MYCLECLRLPQVKLLRQRFCYRERGALETRHWKNERNEQHFITGSSLRLAPVIKAQLQDRYKQYDIINYANLITNTNYKIISNLQTLSTNSNYKFTLHYIHSQLDLIKDVVNNMKPNNMYRYFISVYTTLYATIYPILSY